MRPGIRSGLLLDARSCSRSASFPVFVLSRAAAIASIPARLGFACIALAIAGCAPRPGDILQRSGDEIVVCGQLVHTGAPVVLWLDPGGYDAYRVEPRFARKPRPATTRPGPTSTSGPAPSQTASAPALASEPSLPPARYHSLRRHLSEDVARQVQEGGWTPPLLAESVDLFVIHYDVCGTSRRCFQVLHDMRGLSVHFMLDVDGTIYQTLDAKERAWHAGTANDRSVGIEIAQIGAYPDTKVLDEWYGRDDSGYPYVTFPSWIEVTGIRTPQFIARPARPQLITGEINGRVLHQYDFTDAQYESLIGLAAALCRTLPRIRPDFPRDAAGRLRTSMLTPEEMERFSGVLGHYHVTDQKTDPGPAFDWERLIAGVRRRLWPFPTLPVVSYRALF